MSGEYAWAPAKVATPSPAPRSGEHVTSPEGHALWCAQAVLAVPGARMVPAPKPCAFQGLCLILILIHEFVLEDFFMFLCVSLEAFIGQC